MKFPIPVAFVAFAALIFAYPARALPVTFMGEDLNPGGDPNNLTTFPNSTAARVALFNHLSGVGIETFDGLGVGVVNPTVNFVGPTGTVSATLSGGTVVTRPNAGRYPISGANYLATGTGSFTVTFDQAVAAFGFFGTDIGDFGGSLMIRLTDINNMVSTLPVNNIIGSCPFPGTGPCSDPTSGSVLYFGFYDKNIQYSKIEFINDSVVDNFGFDSFSVGTLAQVTPVPEIPTALLMAAGLVLIGREARRLTPRAGVKRA